MPAAPLFIVLNAASGRGRTPETRAAIESTLRESGRQYEIVVVEDGAAIAAAARRAVERAMRRGGAVVAAGGDGTINAVAQAAHAAACPMGVLPQGTFNYFSRTHGIPVDAAQAAHSLLNAKVQPVQVGMVNERVFLVNASLGLYPEILQDREQFKARFGRNRAVAALAAVATVLREHRQLRLRIELDGLLRDVRASSLFIGNNRLQLEQVGIPPPPAVATGRLAAVMLKPVGTIDMLRLLVRGALGTLGDADQLESFQFQRMTVVPWLPYGTRRVKVAADGEVMWMRSPLEFRVPAQPLYLLKPASVNAVQQDHAQMHRAENA
jgi:diacylglycerol kinase family enzyme